MQQGLIKGVDTFQAITRPRFQNEDALIWHL